MKFTGHPLPDVGLATVCAMAGKERPEDLSLGDLDSVADELAVNYFSGLMGSYLSCVFMNAEYVQPEPKTAEGRLKKNETRKSYEKRYLRAYKPSETSKVSGHLCAYCGERATDLVHRSQVPLLTGEGVLNFYPAGRGRLPVCGFCLMSIQALPMGGRRSEGKLLLVHSDDVDLMIGLARKYVEDNRRLLNLARAGQLPAKKGPDESLIREHAAKDSKSASAKYPDAKQPSSMVAADLLDVSLARSSAQSRQASVTVYHISNSGQGPSVQLYTIPSQLVRFLRLVNRPPTDIRWRSLLNRAWRDPLEAPDSNEGGDGQQDEPAQKEKRAVRRAKKSTAVSGGPGRSRNDVLADLFPIFDAGFTDLAEAARFLRRHFLRDTRWSSFTSPDPKKGRGLDGAELVDWSLTSLFLREVIGMNSKRLDSIKVFADRLADHVATTRDKRFFQDVVFAKRQWEVRNALTKAQRNEARERGILLFGLQEFLDVFEADDAVGMQDWGLVRDLICIRLVEALHKKDFFKQNADWLGSPDSSDQDVLEPV